MLKRALKRAHPFASGCPALSAAIYSMLKRALKPAALLYTSFLNSPSGNLLDAQAGIETYHAHWNDDASVKRGNLLDAQAGIETLVARSAWLSELVGGNLLDAQAGIETHFLHPVLSPARGNLLDAQAGIETQSARSWSK